MASISQRMMIEADKHKLVDAGLYQLQLEVYSILQMTRLDITFAVTNASKFGSSQTNQDLIAVKHRVPKIICCKRAGSWILWDGDQDDRRFYLRLYFSSWLMTNETTLHMKTIQCSDSPANISFQNFSYQLFCFQEALHFHVYLHAYCLM